MRSIIRWFRFLQWKYLNKDPRIETIDDFRFWDNKMFNEHEGEAHEDDKYLH